MTEQKYKIIGIKNKGKLKMLELQHESLVTVKDKVDPMEALHDIGGFVQKMRMQTEEIRVLDIIHITTDEFKKRDLHIDGVFTIRY